VIQWRNLLKQQLSDYLYQALFTLKELDNEGVRYTVFLEDFPCGVENRVVSLFVQKVKGWHSLQSSQAKINKTTCEINSCCNLEALANKLYGTAGLTIDEVWEMTLIDRQHKETLQPLLQGSLKDYVVSKMGISHHLS
jgi:methylthioribose-1-phosphate isomerase